MLYVCGTYAFVVAGLRMAQHLLHIWQEYGLKEGKLSKNKGFHNPQLGGMMQKMGEKTQKGVLQVFEMTELSGSPRGLEGAPVVERPDAL